MTNYFAPVIISGPSGSGKDTLVKAIINKYPQIHDAVGCTTRNKRENEVDGVDMRFVSKKVFKKMVVDGEFVEYSQYAGNYYGMTFLELNRAHTIPTIFNVGVFAAQTIKQYFNESISILVIPPSKEELLKRLGDRGVERYNSAKKDILFAKSFFEYVIISKNYMIEEEVADFENIVLFKEESYKLKYFVNFIDDFFK